MEVVMAAPKDVLRIIYGNEVEITDIRTVSGGDINETYRISLSGGNAVFMKKHAGLGMAFFQAEADGLDAIRQTGTISVPGVLAVGEDPSDGKACLLMEYIRPAVRRQDFWEHFGRQLAEMHRASTSGLVPGGIYGFRSDNYIGANKQVNTPAETWISFYRECRLEYQYRRAYPYLDSGDRKSMQHILDHLDQWLTEPAYPSLLHGDLWGGNYITGEDGQAWLIDPAVYVGNREADLAMTELFGGFSSSFYEAYRETAPLDPGYAERRNLYHLYHLLNHLNLFGPAYLASVRSIIRSYH